MKKWKIILGSLLLFIVLAISGVYLYIYLTTKHADQEIDKVIHQSGIPKDQVIVIQKTECNFPSVSLGYEWFTKKITTKKDYANWKKLVQTNHRFLNGQRLTDKNKEKLNSPVNCELIYYFSYSNYTKKVDARYVPATKAKEVKSKFAYTLLDSALVVD
ncbi:hypothetical protein [Listeria sp. PSOL-1]|uniref:hypothetical protein n=1 Tax=Listeria sp. PSOL-1 TaxID=1844999 RepID=UPI0013D0C69D|nr:hypothetical protein [Listeria sp. PSOL-1]